MNLFPFLEAYVLLLLVTLRLRFFSTQAVFHAISHPQYPTPCYSPVEEWKIIEITQQSFQQAEGKIPFRITCLQRAVALQHLLGRRRIATRLQIGVRKHGKRLEAH